MKTFFKKIKNYSLIESVKYNDIDFINSLSDKFILFVYDNAIEISLNGKYFWFDKNKIKYLLNNPKFNINVVTYDNFINDLSNHKSKISSIKLITTNKETILIPNTITCDFIYCDDYNVEIQYAKPYVLLTINENSILKVKKINENIF